MGEGESSPDTDNLICLAKLYKISLDDLLEIDDEDTIEDIASKNSKKENIPQIGKLIISVTPLLSIFIFCLLGSVWGLWHPAWIIFLSIPILTTLVIAIEKKNFAIFAYPIFLLGIYLCVGFIWSIWHPAWVIFLTIPIYYSFSSFFARKQLLKKQ